METYAAARKLVYNPDYPEQRKKMLSGLSNDMIDEPIVDIINGFNTISCCFTIQCCFGHFIHDRQPNPHNIEALPATNTISTVMYCIAYICFCIENSKNGRNLLKKLQEVTHIDPENVQFCSAE